MAWKVKRIQEGDYGCEERSDEERNLVLVTLENDAGLTRQLTADEASGRRSPPPSCRSKPQKNQCKGKY